ncbi:hypothetical protein C0058_00350 [Pseudomonas sp. NC02]|nr:hypothetical protein C0058_00350 [Pseudomonas sp. NC02]
MWERACSRRRCVSQQKMYRLNHRLREQARSHIGLDRSHALRGNAALDALRPLFRSGFRPWIRTPAGSRLCTSQE